MTLYEWFEILLGALLTGVIIRAGLRRIRARRILASTDDKLEEIRTQELFNEATAANPHTRPSIALLKLYQQYGTTLRLSRTQFGDPTYRSIRSLIIRDRILIGRRAAIEIQREFEREFGGISLPTKVSHPN